jgi:ATP-binding cassette subfamily B protein
MGIITPLREVHRILDEAHESSLQVADLLSMLAEPIDQSFDDRQAEQPCLSTDIPLVEAKDLRMDYGINGKRVRALDGVSLSIRQGEVIGVAGLSGSGKSTLLRALLRLTHPSGGTLRIGGVPISAVSRETIGRLVGFVSQTPFLFSGTIAENIAYDCPGASLEEIKRAASLARIDQEVVAMPGGYESRVSERGQNLSGGQRQRLALARIFLKNPPILILDEATAALDNLNEHAVLEALGDAMTGRTVIIVAHRLSTLRDTDRIYVFDAGHIVEEGHFDQLVRNGGLFARLAHGTLDQSDLRQSPRQHVGEG